ncbi:MAG: hypothetical protein R3F31_16630 [Verrucomicrobiales bacterium]
MTAGLDSKWRMSPAGMMVAMASPVVRLRPSKLKASEAILPGNGVLMMVGIATVSRSPSSLLPVLQGASLLEDNSHHPPNGKTRNSVFA